MACYTLYLSLRLRRLKFRDCRAIGGSLQKWEEKCDGGGDGDGGGGDGGGGGGGGSGGGGVCSGGIEF